MDYVSINGQIVPYEDARIAPGDAGFLHGAGLFETLRVKNRVPFRLGDHVNRLARSAQAMGMTIDLSETQLRELIAELLEANDLTDARLRLTLTRGDLHAMDAAHPIPPVTLALSTAAFAPYPPELYARGMTVAISAYRQNVESPLTGHKTTSYLDRLTALREAQLAGAGEALWFTVHDHFLAEGCISNVFLVDSNGILVTPPLLKSHELKSQEAERRLVLPGITRGLALALAREANILPHERLVTVDELLAAREIFLTNAIMGIMPVVRVERHAVGDEKPGAITRQLSAAYAQRLQEECGG